MFFYFENRGEKMRLKVSVLFIVAGILVGCGESYTDYSKLDKNKEPLFKDFVNEPVKDGELFIYYPAPYKDSQLVCKDDLATEALRKKNIPYIKIFKYLDEESKKEGSHLATLMEYDQYKFPELRRHIVPFKVTKQGSGYVRNDDTEAAKKTNRSYLYVDVLKRDAQSYQETSRGWVSLFIKRKPEAECRVIE